MFTKEKEPITWHGYACTQWVASKEISTNFLLSYDIVFKNKLFKTAQTRPVSIHLLD